MSNVNADWQNVWFLVQNGNLNLRDLTLEIGQLFVGNGKLLENSYTTTVLTIALVCIGITILASLVFIPVTFSLDDEEKEIVHFWLLINEDTKVSVI